MKLTLNKANKVLKSIERELDDVRGKFASKFAYSIHYNRISDTDTEIEKLATAQKDYEVLNLKFLSLEVDAFELKNKIDEKNTEVGINSILKSINRVASMIATYQTIVIQYENRDFIISNQVISTLNDDIEKMKLSDEIIKKSINFSLIDIETVKTNIKEQKKMLSNLEDKKFELNNSKSIEIELSQYTKDLVGISE